VDILSWCWLKACAIKDLLLANKEGYTVKSGVKNFFEGGKLKILQKIVTFVP